MRKKEANSQAIHQLSEKRFANFCKRRSNCGRHRKLISKPVADFRPIGIEWQECAT
jgi:hypothetical protein